MLCLSLNAQHTKIYSSELLDNFKLEVAPDSFQIIQQKTKNKNLVFIINTKKTSHRLPTYKDFIIYDSDCQLSRHDVKSKYFGNIELPKQSFIVLVPNSQSPLCP